MSTFTEISIYLIQALANAYLLVTLLRFLLQLCRANFYNPVSQFIVKATAAPLIVLAKVFPTIKNVNTAALALAMAVPILAIQSSVLIYNGQFVPILPMLIWSLLGMATMLLNIYFYGLLIIIILSWVAPQSHHPAVALLSQLMEPAMAPFRRLLPALGGLDLSPILIFLLLNVLKIFIHNLAVSANLASAFVPGIM
tara:strand:- start:1579 stop:2169 length:591 start_codon:yes stop_codon:yes gene_type:complete